MKKSLLLLAFAATPFLVNAQCTAQLSSTDVTCYNACDGTATAIPSGGTPPYTYLWGPQGQTTQTVTGLCTGSYNVNVIDDVGCSTTLFFTITQPPQITLTYSQVPATCTTCCDGSATALPSGGSTPYTYSWFPSGNTNATETGLCPGTYSFTVTDANGCTVGMLCNVGNSVGIQDQAVAGNLSVYPSPADESLTFDITFPNPAYAEISISNLPGEIVFMKTTGSTTQLHETIRVAELPAGIYFITVRTAFGSSIQKFVKD